MDEPSSGLDQYETERFGAILRGIVDERGVGIVLVEHDMRLVMQVCDYIYVLEFGQKIFEGNARASAKTHRLSAMPTWVQKTWVQKTLEPARRCCNGEPAEGHPRQAPSQSARGRVCSCSTASAPVTGWRPSCAT